MKAIDMTHIYGNRLYKGKWVAVDNIEKPEPVVIAAGKSLEEALRKAKDKGVNLPTMMRIPRKVLSIVGGWRVGNI